MSETTNTNPCFCHLNGYEVKDAKSRAAIEELEAKKVNNTTMDEKETEINKKIESVKTDLNNLETRFNTMKVTGEAENIVFKNEGTGLEATNVQGAIEEVKTMASKVAQGTALGTTYDNAESGMEATNVQDAIDEVKKIAESNEGITMKYNSDDDYIYILINGGWEKWRVAGFKDLVALIPVMISDTHEKGNVVSNGAVSSTYPTHYAFDSNNATKTITVNTINPYLGFEWFEHVSIKKIVVDYENAHEGSRNYNFVLQKFDGATWEDISNTEKSVSMVTAGKEQLIWNLEEMVDCKGLRLMGTSNNGGFSLQVTSMQVYGY